MFDYHNFQALLSHVVSHGELVSSRAGDTLEIVNFSLSNNDPRQRIVTSPARKMNVAFGIAEWLEYMTGGDDCSAISTFVPNMKNFCEDGRIDSAYGPRLRGGQDALQRVIDILRKDEFARHAVIAIYATTDLWHKGPSVPCTLTLQFLIRNNKLHLIVTMRSNDVIWGFTYDHFSFTMIQEFVALHVGIELGSYLHNAGSFHFYTSRDWEMGRKILDEAPSIEPSMSRMPLITLDELKEIRQAVYNTRAMTITGYPQYWQDLISACRFMHIRKESPVDAIEILKSISDLSLTQSLRNFITDKVA